MAKGRMKHMRRGRQRAGDTLADAGPRLGVVIDMDDLMSHIAMRAMARAAGQYDDSDEEDSGGDDTHDHRTNDNSYRRRTQGHSSTQRDQYHPARQSSPPRKPSCIIEVLDTDDEGEPAAAEGSKGAPVDPEAEAEAARVAAKAAKKQAAKDKKKARKQAEREIKAAQLAIIPYVPWSLGHIVQAATAKAAAVGAV